MNRIIALLNLSNTTNKNQNKLSECTFATPHWQPDHHNIIHDGMVALSATQRFVTPQCADCLMPYQDSDGKLWINADVYLTNHDDLCTLLGMCNSTADAKLILEAYQKYGHECLSHFSGYFSFVIYDQSKDELFAAVDQFSSNPLYYCYEAGKQFICANEFSPFRKLSTHLTINEKHYFEITFDTFSLTETSYNEVFRLRGGYYLIVNKSGCQEYRYWELKKTKLAKMNRDEYYQEFRRLFQKAVDSCLRNIGESCSHVSGGMDSSSVSAQAATILAKRNKKLHSFTALPNGLEGESNHANWYYHEMPIVESLLNMYPNIIHYRHYSRVHEDIYQQLAVINPYIDQPIRNIANIEWILASYEFANNNNSRTILTGAVGNATISWAGMSLRNRLSKIRLYLRLKIKPSRALNTFFTYVRRDVLKSKAGKQLMFKRGFVLDSQLYLTTKAATALKSTIYILQLWSGSKNLDPTIDKDLVEFCYNLPQWVYYKNNKTVNRRLLVREALKDILPVTITQNIGRGEQAADFYLSYNIYQQEWLNRLTNLKPNTQEIIWKYFDKEKMLQFFKEYPQIPDKPNYITTTQLMILSRCLSFAFYLDQ